MALYVGTSGWAYREWKPNFYPKDLPHAGFLQHYSAQLSACEINATFYRLQTDKTFERWGRQTPETFRFATKAHRRLTHARNFDPSADESGFLATFLKSVATLGPRQGPVLFQFPPYRRRDDDALDALLRALPGDKIYAFEFRDESWDDPAVAARIAGSGATVCYAETTGKVPAALPEGQIGYVRMRFDGYSEAARAGWLELLQAEGAGRDVYAFTKHEGSPVDDPFSGIGLALWLAHNGGAERLGP